jgi:hypothetical protein
MVHVEDVAGEGFLSSRLRRGTSRAELPAWEGKRAFLRAAFPLTKRRKRALFVW